MVDINRTIRNMYDPPYKLLVERADQIARDQGALSLYQTREPLRHALAAVALGACAALPASDCEDLLYAKTPGYTVTYDAVNQLAKDLVAQAAADRAQGYVRYGGRGRVYIMIAAAQHIDTTPYVALGLASGREKWQQSALAWHRALACAKDEYSLLAATRWKSKAVRTALSEAWRDLRTCLDYEYSASVYSYERMPVNTQKPHDGG